MGVKNRIFMIQFVNISGKTAHGLLVQGVQSCCSIYRITRRFSDPLALDTFVLPLFSVHRKEERAGALVAPIPHLLLGECSSICI